MSGTGGIPPERYGVRLAAARREASAAGLDALLVVCGESGPIVLNEAPRDLLLVAG